jgi:UDP-N-acetyl-D-glucosamine dehydrogenase
MAKVDIMDIKAQVLKKIEEKKANVSILGLGYVGLPLAVAFAKAGFKVIGIDPIKSKVDLINSGESYILDVSTAEVAELVKSGRLSASTDFSNLRNADAVSICVPTPLKQTGDPDLSFIVNSVDELAKYIHPGMVIVLESTTYPGTTRELALPRLEGKGQVVGKDFFLAFSPERVDPGRKDYTTYNTPKVMGGITPNCNEVATAWYGKAIKTVVTVSNADVAEMAKLLENTFRMINIGLVNELALICDRLGMDVWEVIDAAATKPFGFMKFQPGPGLGGHCIPIDPLYLSWKLKALNYNARFIELASEINTGMPRFAVSKVQDALNNHGKALKGSKILVLGVTYKADIDDLRESPALDVIHLLEQKGAEVNFHDPYIKSFTVEGKKKDCITDLMKAIGLMDAVVIITNHSSYDYQAILNNTNLIVDTRNALGKLGKDNPKVVRL